MLQHLLSPGELVESIYGFIYLNCLNEQSGSAANGQQVQHSTTAGPAAAYTCLPGQLTAYAESLDAERALLWISCFVSLANSTRTAGQRQLQVSNLDGDALAWRAQLFYPASCPAAVNTPHVNCQVTILRGLC